MKQFNQGQQLKQKSHFETKYVMKGGRADTLRAGTCAVSFLILHSVWKFIASEGYILFDPNRDVL